MPADIDRRLRRRLGLESEASPRRVWLRPALAAFAIAAVVVAVIAARPKDESPQRVAAGFVDISKATWSGTATSDAIDVRADSPMSATVVLGNAAIVAAPGTRMATTSAGSLVLTQGSIQIQRTDVTPMFVDVPVGRVVISAYRSSVTADRESVTIVLDDGTGHYVDATGQSHPLVADVPLVWPPTNGPRGSVRVPDASDPATVPPAPKNANSRSTVAPAPRLPEQPAASQGPPGTTPPLVRPDVPCTFKSDCEEGATCRKNERGDSVCMGNGGDGAACWFDNDCLSQQCAQRRCASRP